MKILCNDGIRREFIGAEHPISQAILIYGTSKARLTGKPAYCKHCNERFGNESLVDQKESLRTHNCNLRYNHENKLKLTSI